MKSCLILNHNDFSTVRPILSRIISGAAMSFLIGSSALAAPSSQILTSFEGGLAGSNPRGGVIGNAKQVLFGTTAQGGSSDSGVVYSLAPPASGSGPWTETVLFQFNGTTNGNYPLDQLAMDDKGRLFGVTLEGGKCPSKLNGQCGTVFMLTPPAKGKTAWTQKTLWSFSGSAAGQAPQFGVVLDASGNLYGTTAGGGNPACSFYAVKGCGIIYKLSPPASGQGKYSFTTIWSFTGGADGNQPNSRTVFDKGGVILVSVSQSPNHSFGKIVELTPPSAGGSAWSAAPLWTFSGGLDGAYRHK